MAFRRSAGKQDEEPPIDLKASEEHSWWTADRTPPEPEPEPDPDDPYVVLKVDPSAPWEEIVGSYHRLARMWHPDGLQNPVPGERELCDDMIRRLNIAYSELRVRRGR